MPSPSRRVAVVGGGLAGLAASCALADSGFQVVLFERRPYLGGRASSYQHPGTGEIVDNCQHVLFGSCTNLIDLYRKIGVSDKIRWSDEMTFIEPGGRTSRLRASFLPAPFHTTPAFLRFRFLKMKDKLSIARALAAILPAPLPDTGKSFLDWLRHHGQTQNSIERFWKPVLISALSEGLDRMSVSYAAQVVRESMKSETAQRMGIPTVALTELYAAAQEYIVARGGTVRLRCNAEKFHPETEGATLSLADGTEQFDFVVLAVPFSVLATMLPKEAASQQLQNSLAGLETSPITGVHLWFDRRITDLEHAVLLDCTIQWMFHKSKLLSRNATSSGSYIELVISSSKGLVEKSKQEIIDLAVSEVKEFFPAAGSANLLKSTVVKEVHATFAPRPGVDAFRPVAKTAWPRVFLAGDWTATGWPATMEGAVRSGYLAAEWVTRMAGEKKRNFLVPDLPATGLMRLFE